MVVIDRSKHNVRCVGETYLYSALFQTIDQEFSLLNSYNDSKRTCEGV